MKAYVIYKNEKKALPENIRVKLKLHKGTEIPAKDFFYMVIGITGTNGRALKSLMEEKNSTRNS